MEWDKDSFDRRFLGSMARFRGLDGTDQWIGVHNTDYEMDNLLSVKDYLTGKVVYTPIVNKDYPLKDLLEYGYNNIGTFIYETPAAGWYHYRENNDVPVLVYRKLAKSFKIGLNSESFWIYFWFQDQWKTVSPYKVDVTKPIKKGDFGKSKIRGQIALLGDAVTFLGETIGIRTDNKIVLKRPSFTKLLEKELPEWQIVL